MVPETDENIISNELLTTEKVNDRNKHMYKRALQYIRGTINKKADRKAELKFLTKYEYNIICHTNLEKCQHLRTKNMGHTILEIQITYDG